MAQRVTLEFDAVISNLNNVRESLRSLQEEFKPNTKRWYEIQKILNDVEEKAINFRNVASDGFSTKGEMQKEMKSVEKSLQNAKGYLENFGEIKPKDLAIVDEGKIKKDIDLFKSVQKELERISKGIEEVNKTKIELDTTGTKQKKAATQVKSILNGDRGDHTIFRQNGTFTNGGRENLENLFADAGLSTQTIEKIRTTKASELKNLREEVVKQLEAITKETNATMAGNAKKGSELETAFAVLQNQLKDSNGNFLPGFESLSGNISDLPQMINLVAEAMAHYMQEATGGSNASDKLVQGLNTTKEALNGVRGQAENTAKEFDRLQNIKKTTDNLKNLITRWMGVYQVLNLVKRGIKAIITDIRNLDKVMTQIAVVTNMTQADLWAQMGQYQNVARQFAVSTEGVYQVSQLFYQQGLDTNSVMQLTAETLKMAKIAGLDYAVATDYMTVAVRGFKMEMSESQKVVDVYANIAAKSASDTEELATAMSKTASSAQAVGASFENTTAMIALMIETTR